MPGRRLRRIVASAAPSWSRSRHHVPIGVGAVERDLMAAVAGDFRANGTDVIYGTIRLVERDEETFLAWAREPWACIIFNLHTVHTPEGLERASRAFRGLIDRGIERCHRA